MDTPWSVRIPEELKEKLTVLITESGQNAKDFMNQLVQLYTLKEAGKHYSLAGVDIEELTQLTGRINQIYLHLLDRAQSFQKQAEDDFQLKMDEKTAIISVFQGKLQELEGQVVCFEQETLELQSKNEELHAQYIQQSEICEANKALVTEYKQKIEDMNGTCAQNKELQASMLSMKTTWEEEKEKRFIAENKLMQAQLEIEALKQSLRAEADAYENKLQREIELLELQKERMLLQVTKESQQKMQAEQEIYNAKVKELLHTIETMHRKKPTEKNTPTKG